MRRRWMVYTVCAMLIVAGAVACGGGWKPSYLTAVDRSTGAPRWSVKLPRTGATEIGLDGDHLLVSVCEWSQLLINPKNGDIIKEQIPDLNVFPGSRPGANTGAAVLWKDPGPHGFGPRIADEFTYDKKTKSLVSKKGWSVKVQVGGPYPHIPVLTDADTVYFVEHVGACTGGD